MPSPTLLTQCVFTLETRPSLLLLLRSLGLDGLGRHVLGVVEVSEESEERDHVVEENLGDELGVGRVREEVHALAQVQEELEHLHLRQVPAPPQVLFPPFLVLAHQHGEQVVRVHAHVHPRVQRGGEIRVAARRAVGDHPPHEGDGAVVVDVKEADLLQVVLDEHDERVQEFVHFAHVEDPDVVRHGGLLGVVLVTPDRVSVLVRLEDAADAHVQRERDEEDVVEDHQVPNPGWVLLRGILRFVPQDPHAGAHDEEVGREGREQDGGRRDRDPVLSHGAERENVPVDRLWIDREGRGRQRWSRDGMEISSMIRSNQVQG